MKHIVLIICHRVTPALVHTLNEIEATKESFAVVHVDKKCNINEFDFIKHLDSSVLIEERTLVSWGDVSQIVCMMLCMTYIDKFYDYDYFSVISGDDIFYRGLNQFNQFLSENRGREFIGTSNLMGVTGRTAFRFERLYPLSFYDRSSSIRSKLNRKVTQFLFNIGFLENRNKRPFKKMYKGSNWFTITKECLGYIILFNEENPKYLNYFKNSYCCDEVFFHSIVYNSIFRNNTLAVINNNNDDNVMSCRKIDWVSGPSFPKVFNENDILNIRDEETFILRKIDSQLDKVSISRIVNNFNG
ncbi:beta-1,6-N-acetylglucosaminyltransferase [Vibrio splendidus]